MIRERIGETIRERIATRGGRDAEQDRLRDRGRAGLRSSQTIVLPCAHITRLVLVVVNVDPHGTREATVHLDMPALGMQWSERFPVLDELTGDSWTWGERNYVRLDPYVEPAHVFTVRRPEQ